jgi:hypothetical protein
MTNAALLNWKIMCVLRDPGTNARRIWRSRHATVGSPQAEDSTVARLPYLLVPPACRVGHVCSGTLSF